MNQTTNFLEIVNQSYWVEPYIVYFIGLCIPVGFYYTQCHYFEWQIRNGPNILSEREYQLGATLVSCIAFLPIFWITEIYDYWLGVWTILLNLIGLRIMHHILYFLTLRRRDREIY